MRTLPLIFTKKFFSENPCNLHETQTVLSDLPTQKPLCEGLGLGGVCVHACRCVVVVRILADHRLRDEHEGTPTNVIGDSLERSTHVNLVRTRCSRSADYLRVKRYPSLHSGWPVCATQCCPRCAFSLHRGFLGVCSAVWSS